MENTAFEDGSGLPPIDVPSRMLGGLSASAFMRRHWQKQPLLVRQAFPGIVPPLSRAQLFRLAEREGVESRLISRSGSGRRATWTLRHGPLPRRSLPSLAQPDWTLLVQGLDLHVDAARELLSRFRFVPQARLDDVMVSWAAEGGGVGPHVDSYDVFLVQVHGRRRWRIAPPGDGRLRPGLPVKILADFRPVQEWELSPGDMLYLPPGWEHDGDAVGGECMTCSVGFRAAAQVELARETLLRLADGADDQADQLYRDPQQGATVQPGLIPPSLERFARRSLEQVLKEPGAFARALGEYLSEPKPRVAFRPGRGLEEGDAIALAPGSCMLYDDQRVFMNGESWLAAGRDADMLRELADHQWLGAKALRRASRALRGLIADWIGAGWVHAVSSRESGHVR